MLSRKSYELIAENVASQILVGQNYKTDEHLKGITRYQEVYSIALWITALKHENRAFNPMKFIKHIETFKLAHFYPFHDIYQYSRKGLDKETLALAHWNRFKKRNTYTEQEVLKMCDMRVELYKEDLMKIKR